MNANTKQIGGDHYITENGVQLWDYLAAIDAPFLEGNAAKYLFRWRKKGGVTDLQKALHYVEKRLDVIANGGAWRIVPKENLRMFSMLIDDNDVATPDTKVINIVLHWRTTSDLLMAVNRINDMIANEIEINKNEMPK